MKMFKHILSIKPSLFSDIDNQTYYITVFLQLAILHEKVDMINRLEEVCTINFDLARSGKHLNQVLSEIAASCGNPVVFDAVWSKLSPIEVDHNISFQRSLAAAIINSTPFMVEHIIQRLADQVTIKLQDVRSKTSTSDDPQNILQLAAASGKPEMVICVRKICEQYKIGITPDSRNEAGKTAFDYASTDAVKDALRAPLSESVKLHR